MQHLQKFNNFLNENKEHEQKNVSIFGIAWNVLTLGLGYKILGNMNNIFSIRKYLIKTKLIKIEKILIKTIATYNSNILENKQEVDNNINTIKVMIQRDVDHIQFDEIKDKLFNVLLKYEIQYRILGFNKMIEGILNKIKSDIKKIGPDINEAKLILSDLKILLKKLDSNVEILMKQERTKLLPDYDIKNVVLSVSNIINYKNDEKIKKRLTYTWQKGKNKLYQQYEDKFVISTLNDLLDHTKYNVNNKEDKALDVIYKELPDEIKKINKNVTDVENLRPLDDFTLNDYGAYYVFNYNDYSIVVNYINTNSDNISIFVSIGTYKYNSKNAKFEQKTIQSKKYSKINEFPHIFYYIPNFKGYIIEGVDSYGSSTYSFTTHNHSSLTSKIGNYAKVDSTSTSSMSAFEQYVQINISKLNWFKEYTGIGKVTDEFKNEIKNDPQNSNSLNLISNGNFNDKWDFVKINILNKVNWTPTLTFDECKTNIFKITT